MRYINLSTVLVYRLVSEKVMERFPDYESLVIAKLILPHEVERLKRTEKKTPHEMTWTPILVAMIILWGYFWTRLSKCQRQRIREENIISGVYSRIFGPLISQVVMCDQWIAHSMYDEYHDSPYFHALKSSCFMHY